MADASIDKISQKLQGLTISSSDIQSVGEEIGRGTYGKVYTVKYRGSTCAVKEIHSILVGDDVGPEEQRSVKEAFLRECHHCSTLKHPNIVRFIGVYYPKRDSNIPAMIMELMDESYYYYYYQFCQMTGSHKRITCKRAPQHMYMDTSRHIQQTN